MVTARSSAGATNRTTLAISSTRDGVGSIHCTMRTCSKRRLTRDERRNRDRPQRGTEQPPGESGWGDETPSQDRAKDHQQHERGRGHPWPLQQQVRDHQWSSRRSSEGKGHVGGARHALHRRRPKRHRQLARKVRVEVCGDHTDQDELRFRTASTPNAQRITQQETSRLSAAPRAK